MTNYRVHKNGDGTGIAFRSFLDNSSEDPLTEYELVLGMLADMRDTVDLDGSLNTHDEYVSVAQDAMAALDGFSAMAHEIRELKKQVKP